RAQARARAAPPATAPRTTPAPRGLVVREDGNPVDPLPDLALVNLDEGGDLDAGVHQHARMELPDRPGAPHDSWPPVERVPAQVVDLAARERRQRVTRIRPYQPRRVVAPVEDRLLEVTEAAACSPKATPPPHPSSPSSSSTAS